MAVLEVHNIEKNFGATKVLEDISFELEQGQALAIIGSSGSGKTTLLRCLNFLETPDQGKIIVQGKTLFDAADPNTQKESEVRKKAPPLRLVSSPSNLFPQYTALKNVTLAKELLLRSSPTIRVEKRNSGGDRGGGPGIIGQDGAGGPGGALPPPALRRAAAAGGHRPGSGPSPGYPLL